ncbi:hypothetical protein, partial [Citrobacter sp. VF227]
LCVFTPRPIATIFTFTDFSEPCLFPSASTARLRLPAVEHAAHHLSVKYHPAPFHASTFLLFISSAIR